MVLMSHECMCLPGMCVPLYLMCISCRPASVGEYCTVTVPSRLSVIRGWADLPEGINTSPVREVSWLAIFIMEESDCPFIGQCLKLWSPLTYSFVQTVSFLITKLIILTHECLIHISIYWLLTSVDSHKKNNILLQVAEYAGFVPQRNPESWKCVLSLCWSE